MTYDIRTCGRKIYLRDLNEKWKKAGMEEIRRERPELYKMVIEGYDILIGYTVKVEDYFAV
mgnify:CR=1 FL=1